MPLFLKVKCFPQGAVIWGWLFYVLSTFSVVCNHGEKKGQVGAQLSFPRFCYSCCTKIYYTWFWGVFHSLDVSFKIYSTNSSLFFTSVRKIQSQTSSVLQVSLQQLCPLRESKQVYCMLLTFGKINEMFFVELQLLFLKCRGGVVLVTFLSNICSATLLPLFFSWLPRFETINECIGCAFFLVYILPAFYYWNFDSFSYCF